MTTTNTPLHDRIDEIRVLHVDDEPSFTDMAATVLKREDDRFTVETATSASDGLEQIATKQFDCIVSDYDMPRRNGIEFLEAVRDDYPSLPFILFTGKGSEEIASDAISAGVSDYLQKGTGADRYSLLANRITNLVSQYRAEVQLETRVQQQQHVAALGTEALTDTSSENLFKRAVEIITETLDAEYAKVLEYRPEHDDLLLRAGVGWREGLVGEATVGTGDDSQAGHTLRTEEPIIVEDLRTEESFGGPPLLIEHDVVSGVSVIIGSPDDPWGVLGTHTTERTVFTDDDITFVQNIAHVLANTIERRNHERELKRAKQRLDLALQESGAGVWEWNLDTDDLYWSDELLDLVGIAADEFRTEFDAFEERLHPDDVDPVETALDEALETGTSYQIEQRLEHSDGEYVWFDVRGQVVENLDPLTMVGIGIDITERKEHEVQLQRQRDRFEEFTNVVSHDLRNPLRTAEGHLELATVECDSEHLDHVEQAHDRMQTLIEDLLTLARESESVTDPEPVTLTSLIEGCWATVETGDATLVTDIDRTVQTDERRLKQVFENLMRNAIEHGGEDVTVRIGELADGFYVEDDGRGIPADERETVFDAGYSTNEDGTGFGLSIVKQFVDAHDWSIRVTGGPERGARFEITGVESVAE